MCQGQVSPLTNGILWWANLQVWIVVFPSRADTYGNAVQEAMASGVPCVVSDAGGPSFLVKTGQAGFVCSEAAEFTVAILQPMRHPRLLRRMSEPARSATALAD